MCSQCNPFNHLKSAQAALLSSGTLDAVAREGEGEGNRLHSIENRQTRQRNAVASAKEREGAKGAKPRLIRVPCNNLARRATEMYTTIYHKKQSLPSILPCWWDLESSPLLPSRGRPEQRSNARASLGGEMLPLAPRAAAALATRFE